MYTYMHTYLHTHTYTHTYIHTQGDVGLEFTKGPSGGVAIGKINPGTPAAESGKFKAGDQITMINNKRVDAVDVAQKMLRGPEVCMCMCMYACVHVCLCIYYVCM